MSAQLTLFTAQEGAQEAPTAPQPVAFTNHRSMPKLPLVAPRRRPQKRQSAAFRLKAFMRRLLRDLSIFGLLVLPHVG